MLRGHSVQDDSGAYAVFPEQGSSASQMTAAKIMDVTARWSNCDAQVPDAVSAYTQVRLESQNVEIFGYVFHDKIPWCLLNETCTVVH